ncbi:hypothetical protein V6N13_111406 [Hibiscus sabdariffa]
MATLINPAIPPSPSHGLSIPRTAPTSKFFQVLSLRNRCVRFTYFSRASLDYIAKSGKQPDVLHLHNWQTAIVGPIFWDIFAKQRNNPSTWNTKISNAMKMDFSWDSECYETHVSAYTDVKRFQAERMQLGNLKAFLWVYVDLQ